MVLTRYHLPLVPLPLRTTSSHLLRIWAYQPEPVPMISLGFFPPRATIFRISNNNTRALLCVLYFSSVSCLHGLFKAFCAPPRPFVLSNDPVRPLESSYEQSVRGTRQCA